MKHWAQLTSYKNEAEQQAAAILFKLILAAAIAYLLAGIVAIHNHDVKGIIILAVSIAMLIVPYVLLRRGHASSASITILMLLTGTLTLSAMVGQGINDIAIAAFPIIYFFTSAVLNRTVFRFSIGITLLAILWLTLGDLNGWYVPTPFPQTDWFVFLIVAVVLGVAAYVSDLLATNLRKSLERAGQEIIERKQAEEALIKEQALLKTTLEATADGILVVAMDGTWSTFNQKFLDMWEIPASISETRDDQAALDQVVGSLAHPEEFAAKVKELYENRKMESLDIVELKDGRIFERFSQPQHLNGEIIGRAWSFRDITERKKLEETLKESEQDFRRIIENAITGIYRTTPDGQIILANNALIHMLGYSSFKELTDHNLNEKGFKSKGDRAAFLQRIESERMIKGLESAWENVNGETIIVSESARVVCDKDGNTLFYEGSVEDITERKQAEVALAQSDSLRELLLDIITHDLKNPASVIYALSEAARKNMPENKSLEAIYTSSGRLMDVLNQTTILSQAAFGETIPKEALSLNTIIKETADEFASALNKAEMELVVAIAPDLIIKANPLIGEVLKNYISNAIKYAKVG
ncbi:MAG: PAS domain S-box protein, partial [FCB group bacterium]|nr:PAS domain S-box protein [FCB group bacterium]